MKISELPEPYKSLAIKRREEHFEERSGITSFNIDSVMDAICWAKTPEHKGTNFWAEIYNCKTLDKLPPFPYDKLLEYNQKIQTFKFC